MKDAYEQALDEVLAEVRRAKRNHPNQFVNQHEAMGVLFEEVDELWDEVKKKNSDYDLDAQRLEAVQVAAMAIRFAAELTSPKQ